jgi:hypothetical protein
MAGGFVQKTNGVRRCIEFVRGRFAIAATNKTRHSHMLSVDDCSFDRLSYLVNHQDENQHKQKKVLLNLELLCLFKGHLNIKDQCTSESFSLIKQFLIFFAVFTRRDH